MKVKKKSQALYADLGVITAILVIGLCFYLIFSSMSSSKNGYETSAPLLKYEFPTMYVYTFLHMPIQETDLKELGLDKDKKYYVKDLLYINTDSAKIIIDKYESEYNSQMLKLDSFGNNMLELYERFSEIDYPEDYLIYIEYDRTTIPSIQEALDYENYFFHLKNKDGKYTAVYFTSQQFLVPAGTKNRNNKNK